MGRKLLSTTTRTGSRRESLEHLRQILARQIDEGVHPRDLASLSRRLMLVLEELDGLDDGRVSDEERAVDELRQRRAGRQAAS